MVEILSELNGGRDFRELLRENVLDPIGAQATQASTPKLCTLARTPTLNDMLSVPVCVCITAGLNSFLVGTSDVSVQDKYHFCDISVRTDADRYGGQDPNPVISVPRNKTANEHAGTLNTGTHNAILE